MERGGALQNLSTAVLAFGGEFVGDISDGGWGFSQTDRQRESERARERARADCLSFCLVLFPLPAKSGASRQRPESITRMSVNLSTQGDPLCKQHAAILLCLLPDQSSKRSGSVAIWVRASGNARWRFFFVAVSCSHWLWSLDMSTKISHDFLWNKRNALANWDKPRQRSLAAYLVYCTPAVSYASGVICEILYYSCISLFLER